MDRRTLLATAALLPVSTRAAAMSTASDWDAVAAQYDVTSEVTHLEHGNWGMMARPVLAAWQEQVARVNRDTAYYARRTMIADLKGVEARIAAAFGVSPDEIVLTRNATEGLNAAISQYNKLRPGDAILYSDLDYDSMMAACDSAARARGATVVRIALPEPAIWQGVIDAYAAAFEANPKIRLALLTHVGHRTGLAIPVREIVALARARGIDCIVDAAHSIGQLDFTLPDLDADFVGFNLHKWIGAPLGCGVLYIRKSRIADIDPDPGEPSPRPDSIKARVHTGTPDYAAQLTIPAALDFRASIGAPAIATRLRALRDRWVKPLRDLPGLQILTPDDPRMHGAITSFRLTGKTSNEQNQAIARALLEQHNIFTVHRGGVAKGACIRVTPALATRMEEVDRLVPALRALAAS